MFYCMLNSIFIITFALMFSHFLLPLELNIVYKMIFEKYIENILFRLWNIREIAHLFVENMKNERNHSKHLLPAHSSLLLEITNEREIEIYEIMNMVTVRFIQRFMLDSLMIFFSSMWFTNLYNIYLVSFRFALECKNKHHCSSIPLLFKHINFKIST